MSGRRRRVPQGAGPCRQEARRHIFVTDNYDFTEVWTAADGRSFTLAGNGIAKDVKAKSVGGSVYEFTFHNSGQPSTVTDSSGAVVSRDRGNLSFHYTIDIADGTFNFLGVKVSGPHPLFDMDTVQDRRTARRRRTRPGT